jgi:hypothetical protein
LPWNWSWMSKNENLTMEFIEKHPDKPWDWDDVSRNPNITLEDIEKHPNLIFGWICMNPNLTIEFIEKHIKNISRPDFSQNTFQYCKTISRKHMKNFIKNKIDIVKSSLFQCTNICTNVINVISAYCSFM